jgi:cell division protein FtsI/penicillin-binding protein 2
MDKNKIILSIAILIVGIIIGGSIFASQVIKQQSIERQQQIDLQAKQAEAQAIKQSLDNCLATAEQTYKLKTEQRCFSEGYTQEQINNGKCIFSSTQAELDTLNKEAEEFKKELQTDKDNCYKQYK